MAVLIALVFIGIVTAAMLRNTGSQSGASVGYGTMQTAAMNVKSGMVATESYFENSKNSDIILDNLIKNSNDSPFVFRKGDKQPIPDHWISSRLLNIKPGPDSSADYSFEIKSGKKNGRALKTVRAFYHTTKEDGVKVTKTISTMYGGGKNAIYLAGDLKDGNDGMDVTGNATFRGNMKIQNKPSIFRGGSTWIDGDCDILAKGSKFLGTTYVEGNTNIDIQNTTADTIFKSSVGFNGNFKSQAAINVDGDVYINGFFGANINEKFVNVSDNNDPEPTFHYNQKGGAPSWEPDPVKYINNAAVSKVSGFKLDSNEEPISNIPGKLDMGTINDRNEPALDISKVDMSKALPYDKISDASQISLFKLDSLYDASPNNRYNDHLIIKIPAGQRISCGNRTTQGTFNKKVIFIVDGEISGGNGSFYTSGNNASTMVYVTKNGKLDEFGCNGLFRGLIYVDTANTNIQGFKWNDNSKIQGAMHIMGKSQVRWNTGSGNVPKIEYDSGVLNAFGGLRWDADPDEENSVTAEWTETDPNKRRVYLRAAGYYFFP